MSEAARFNRAAFLFCASQHVGGGTVAGNGAALRANDTATRELLERVLGPGDIVPPRAAP